MTRSNIVYTRWFLIMLMVLANSLAAMGQQQQTRSGGTFVNDDDGDPAAREWNAKDNVVASDNIKAYVSMDGINEPYGRVTHFLKATNFGFSLPTGATINGILVEVEANKSGIGVLGMDSKLVKYGSWCGYRSAYWPGAETYFPLGDSAYKWGSTWTTADINASSFGVGIRAQSADANTAIALIDHIRITVFYTPPPPPNAPNLSTPANLSTNVSPSPTFTWSVPTGALRYRLQVSTSPDFSTTIYDQDSITTNSRIVEGLAGLTTYYWRVNATNAGGTSSWSVVRSFTTEGAQIRSGGTFVNDAALGTVDWVGPGNAQTSNDVNSSASLESGNQSRYLKVTDFNFSISNDARIDGIVVEVERRRSGSSTIGTNSVKLVKNGATSGSDKGNSGTVWPTSDAYDSYGGPTDTWGLTVTPGDINASNFGFVINAYNSGSPGTAFIDHIRIKVYYSFPLPAPTLALPGDGATEVSTLPTSGWNLNWNAVLGANSYRLQVSADSLFSSTVFDQSGIVGTSKAVTGLSDGTEYYWRVNASSAIETTDWSGRWSFTAVSPLPADVVISQIYGGGGDWETNGTPYKNDFVELFNRSVAPVGLTGWSIQFATGTGGSWTVIPLSGTIKAGNYFLIKLGSGGYSNGAIELPIADDSGSVNIAPSTGRLALVNNTIALSGSSPVAAYSIIDYVGYGSTASSYEGTGPTGTPDVIKSVKRLADGYTDTNNNGQDFIVAHPTPRNSGKQATREGTTFVNDAALGTVDWAGPDNARTSNNGYTTASLNFTYSKYLRATGFGFTIPSGAAVTGILVAIERSRTGLGGIEDYRVQLIKNGTISSDNKPYYGISWPLGVDVYRNYGGSNQLWGLTWTAEEINSSNFGVALAAQETQGSSGTAQIDHIQITVYYMFSPQPPVLASPANEATDVSTSPTLSWNASNGATSYHLQVSTSSDFATTVFDQGGIGSTSHQVTGLSYSTSYYWRVNSTTPGETSNWSSARSFTTVPPPPPAPILVSPLNGATGVSASITMEWNASSGASSYLLQWSTDSSFTAGDSVSVSQTARLLSGLSYETTYWWKVTARNNAGENTSDKWLFTTELMPVIPETPSLASPIDSAGNIGNFVILSWNSSPGADSYQAQVSTNATFSPTVFNQSGITSTGVFVGNLSYLATYYWRINATNAAGTTDWSTIWTFITTPPPPPPPPESPSLTIPDDGAINISDSPTLSWEASSDASVYRLQVSTNSLFLSLVVDENAIATTTYGLSQLLDSTSYYWRVNASNEGGTGIWSLVRTFRTIPPTPTPPDLVMPMEAEINVATPPKLVWNASPLASSYRLQVSSSSSFAVPVFDQDGIMDTSKAIGGLLSMETYYWRVLASNAGGASEWSFPRSFTTVLPIAETPLEVLPTYEVLDAPLSQNLIWSPAKGAASYTVQWATDSLFSATNAAITPSTYYYPAGLSVSTTYYWRVRSENTSGTSGWSAVQSFTTVQGIPSAPTLAFPADGATNISDSPSLNWNSSSGATTYVLQWSLNSSFVNPHSIVASSTSASLPTLVRSTTYYWRVSAQNNGGASEWTTSRSFTTIPLWPSVPAPIAPCF